jgi:hypothetical protein
MSGKMVKFDDVQSTEIAQTYVKTLDFQLDPVTIIRQIRHCRSTLGSILDELEGGIVGAEANIRIAECTIGLTAEIESLCEAISKSK